MPLASSNKMQQQTNIQIYQQQTKNTTIQTQIKHLALALGVIKEGFHLPHKWHFDNSDQFTENIFASKNTVFLTFLQHCNALFVLSVTVFSYFFYMEIHFHMSFTWHAHCTNLPLTFRFNLIVTFAERNYFVIISGIRKHWRGQRQTGLRSDIKFPMHFHCIEVFVQFLFNVMTLFCF